MLGSIFQVARASFAPLGLILFASAAAQGQSFNIRLTGNTPAPSATFGGAIGQVGVWNALPHSGPFGSGNSTELVDLAGAPSGAFGSIFNCDSDICAVPGYGPDVAALFNTFINGDCYGEPTTVRLNGLDAGHYVVTAYGSTCFPAAHQIGLSLDDLSYAAQKTVGGTYNGSFAEMALGVFAFELPPDTEIIVGMSTFGALSALQITNYGPPVSYCTAKVNSQGCQALISASGSAASLSYPLAFTVSASGVVSNTAGLFFYGWGRDIKPFKGGFHCVKPPTPRLPIQLSGSQGSACTGSFSVDFNAYLQVFGAPYVPAGSILDGQFWFRDGSDPHQSSTSDAIEFAVVP
jgi:hypothetical protein